MKQRFYELRENLYYLFTLRGDYLRIWYRYRLRKALSWKTIDTAWKWGKWPLGAVFAFAAILFGYRFAWTGFSDFVTPSGLFQRGKTLWDWMQLLVIPLLLAILAYSLTNSQKQGELAILLINKREQTLRDYLEYMTRLLLEQDLSDENRFEGAARLARARTLTALEILDGRQKGHLLRFLVEAQLIQKNSQLFSMRRADLSRVELEPVSYGDIDLSGSNLDHACFEHSSFYGAHMMSITIQDADLESADFSSANLDYALFTRSDLYHARLVRATLIKADFQNANLQYANLDGAILRSAKLRGAKLQKASLKDTYLVNADLAFADLSDADLTEADLTKANLSGAKLRNANLTGSNLTGSKITMRQLRQAKSIAGVKLHASSIPQRTGSESIATMHAAKSRKKRPPNPSLQPTRLRRDATNRRKSRRKG